MRLRAGGGTAITVRDLFFNVPARKKFLRSEQTELAHIASLVTHYSLAHPDKTFELWNGATNLLHATPVDTLRERVFQVFGSQMLDDLMISASTSRGSQIPEPDEPPTARSPSRFRLAAAGAEEQPQLDLHLREWPADSRPADSACDLRRVSQSDAAFCFPFALLFLDCDAKRWT